MDTGRGDAATHQDQAGCYGWIKSMSPWRLVWVVVVLIMSGCTMVGPDFVKPEAPLLEDWTEAETRGLSAGQADYGDWWRVFNDPVLDHLVGKDFQCFL